VIALSHHVTWSLIKNKAIHVPSITQLLEADLYGSLSSKRSIIAVATYRAWSDPEKFRRQIAIWSNVVIICPLMSILKKDISLQFVS
jgi:hypothetical protein